MVNPWLEIPLADYEGHMAASTVGQAGMLADELERAAQLHAAKSVAVVGCAGGNGFDRLIGTGTRRIVGIDINPDYVKTARYRFGARIPQLELHVADVQRELPEIVPVDLVFAALVLEYVDVPLALRRLRTLCAPGGHLVTILQMPSSQTEPVSPSAYTSVTALVPAMRLLDPAEAKRGAGEANFSFGSSRRIVLPSAKEFEVLTFRV